MLRRYRERRRRCRLVDAFARPVPSPVLCRLLDVPYEDHDFFQDNTKIVIKRDTPPRSDPRRRYGYMSSSTT
jgi:hypothetical protein